MAAEKYDWQIETRDGSHFTAASKPPIKLQQAVSDGVAVRVIFSQSGYPTISFRTTRTMEVISQRQYHPDRRAMDTCILSDLEARVKRSVPMKKYHVLGFRDNDHTSVVYIDDETGEIELAGRFDGT